MLMDVYASVIQNMERRKGGGIKENLKSQIIGY